MKRFGQRFSAIFFIILSLALLILGRNQNQLIEETRGYIFDAFIPAIKVVDIPRDVTSGFSGWINRIATTFSDNEFLREENAQLKRDLTSSTELLIDNLRLKNLLKIKDGTVSTITASRIVSDSNSPFFKSMLINSGTNDGVNKGHAVVNEEGVIGRTINVAASSSRVLILNDINSRIPVKFAETGVNVILAGDNSLFPIVDFMPADETANIGDQILTSGMGGIFPPDLPVGHVSEISPLGEIKIKTSVHLSRLNYVSVIEYEIASFPVLLNLDDAEQENAAPEEGQVEQ